MYKGGAQAVYVDMKQRFYNQFLEAKRKGKKFNFTTDKLPHYRKGCNKYFLHVATLTHGVPIKCRKYGLKRNNNSVERDHQYSRTLEHNTRGHKNIHGISALFDIGDVYYNYIDTQKLRREKTWRNPAQRAGIKLKLGKRYQLLELIRRSYAED